MNAPRDWSMYSDEYTLHALFPTVRVTRNSTGRLEAFSSARADFDPSVREFVEDFFPGRPVPEDDDDVDLG